MSDLAQVFSRLLSVGLDVLNLAVDKVTGVLLAQLGDSVNGTVASSGAEWWQHVGFTSRPSPSVKGQPGCQAFAVRLGDQDCIIATRDLRMANAIGVLKDGETCVFAGGIDGDAQGKVLLKQDGSVTLFTTDSNDRNGKSVFLRVSPLGLEFSAPWGTWTFNATGWHVQCDKGPALDMGSMGGLPGPLASLSSYVTVTTNICKLDYTQGLFGSSKSPLGYQPATYALSVNPLTQPGVPTGIITLPAVLGAPVVLGVYVSSSTSFAGG